MPKYLPFLDGKYSVAPGLSAMAKADARDQLVFQLDEDYGAYLDNKNSCRREDIRKYYLEDALPTGTITAVNQFLVSRLVEEYPAEFVLQAHSLHNKKTGETLRWQGDWVGIDGDTYLSLFDALCGQVQEDLAICQLAGERDWLAAIHLSAPNHWSPAEKIGKPFGAVHGPVPGMEKLNQQYFKMLLTAVQKGPFCRFAWGIATDSRLNHHPQPPPGVDSVYWAGRKIGEYHSQPLYVRVERQTLTGLPACNAFVFTIRTYFYTIDELSTEEKKALLRAVESMTPESLAYKGLTGTIDALRMRLAPIDL
jgi:hypothetical protein